MKKFHTRYWHSPIVVYFAGPHEYIAVGSLLKANGLHVSAFYTSNVEFYLFGRPAWSRFLAILRSLPLAEDSVFIRSYFPTYGRSHPLNLPGHRSTSMVSSVMSFVADVDASQLRSYWDVVKP